MGKTACWMLALLLPFRAPGAESTWQTHPEWSSEFESRGVSGTAVVFDEQANRTLVFDRALAQAPFLPASTFKVFSALVALETGAVKDEYEVIRWDGTERAIDSWNRDHSLASAMKYSAVWFYQEMARRAGRERMQEWLDKVGYGNRDLGGGLDRFWLSGNLRISAVQQVDFLRRLAAGSLPFSERSQEAVRRITLLEAAPQYALHGKTGWARPEGESRSADLGWFVGWVERAGRRWLFAVKIDMPRGGEDAPKRIAIARAVLTRCGALPASAAK